LRDSADDRFAVRRVKCQIHPVIEGGARLLFEVVEQAREGFAPLHEEVERVERGDYRIPFRDVAREPEPSALLAAHNGVQLHHLRPYIFEADRRLVHGHAKALA